MNCILKLVSVLLLGVVSLISVDTFAADSKGTVFITGANRGIGLSLARNFADAGFVSQCAVRRAQNGCQYQQHHGQY